MSESEIQSKMSLLIAGELDYKTFLKSLPIQTMLGFCELSF